MLYLVIFILLLAAIIALLYVIKVNIILEYAFDGSDDHTTITLSAVGGLINYRRELGKEGIKEKQEDGEEPDEKEKKDGFSEFTDKYSHLKSVYQYIQLMKQYLRNRLLVREVNLNVTVGSGDAFSTSLLCGLAWSMGGMVVSFIANNFHTLKSNMKVQPEYVEKKLNLDIYCIFIIKSVYIIVVALKLLWSTIRKKILSKE